MKKELPLAIVFTLGFLMMLQYFIPHKYSQFLYDESLVWLRIMGTFALILGIGNIFLVNKNKIHRKLPGYGYSFITLGAIVLMLIAGIISTESNSFFNWMFVNVQAPIESTMFSLLAFYIASAAYKAFRARSLQATILLCAAFIVMLGRVSVGQALSDMLFGDENIIPGITRWILEVPNTAAKRGIGLGVGLGMASTSLKIILGIERSYLGGGGK